MSKIKDVVKLKTGYANFVVLKTAFEEAEENAGRMAMYRPTKAHRHALERLSRGLYQPNDKKFYLLSGSYGTGKSHLSLIFANLLSRVSGDPDIKGFYENYEKLDPEAGKRLKNVRKDGQYLVAICDYHAGRRFEDVVLKAVFEACQTKGLDSGVQTEFDEAERLLISWEKKGGGGGSIRDFYTDFQKVLDAVRPGLSVDQLRLGLKDYDSDCLEAFRTAFKEIMGGMEFQAQSGNLIPILKGILKSKAFKERFKGIAILFDEFGTSVLEKASYSKDVLQGFMETCKDEPNIIFMGCIHKDFKAYADRYSAADVSVMNARITHVDLLNEGIEEIIGAIVETEKDSTVWTDEILPKTGVFDQFVPICKTLNLFPWIDDIDRIRQRVLEDIYGMHPMALACLLKLSSEIGSDARSTFTFFSGDVGGAENSYADFIENSETTIAGGKLNLFTVEQLHTFFQKELSSRNPELRDKQRQLVTGYQASLEVLQKAAEGELLKDRRLQGIAILKTILIYHLCQITPSLENIQFGLYCLTKAEQKQVEGDLNYLVKMGALFYRQQSKTYELAISSGEDPYDLIDRYMKNPTLHPENLVSTLIEEAGRNLDTEFLEAKQYNLQFSEDKRFKRYFVKAKDVNDKLWDEIKATWVKSAAKEKNSFEGAVVHVLCEDDAEVQMAKKVAQDVPTDTIAVAIPHQAQPYIDLLLKVKACRHYLPPNEAQKISVQSESRLRDILENPEDGYLAQLQRLFNVILSGEAACWFGLKGKVIVDQPQLPHKPADMLCEGLYKKRCLIKHPDLNFVHDDKWRQGKNTALKQAVDVLLGADKVFIDNGNPDNHGQKRYLEKVLLKGAGALKKTGSAGMVTYFDCETDFQKMSDDFFVLKELMGQIAGLGKGSMLAVGTFLENAKSAPYGAGGTALVLALAFARRAFGERLRVFKDSTKSIEQSLNSYDDLIEIVEDPAAKVAFELKAITPPQSRMVEEIAKALHAKPLMHGESRSLGAAYDQAMEWWKTLPKVSKVADLYEKTKQDHLKELKKLMDTAGSFDKFDFILDKLPALFLGGSPGDTLTDADVDKVVAGFTADVKLLESGLNLVRVSVAEVLSELFGSKGDMVHCENIVKEWYEALNPAQRDPLRYEDKPEAEILMKRLSDSEVHFESKVMTVIPKEFGFDAVKDWNSLQVDAYTAKWRQAKKAVEETVVVIEPPFMKNLSKAKEVKKNYWEVEFGGSLELSISQGAAALIYTMNGEDPKKSRASITSTEAVLFENQFKDKPKIKVIARAVDNHGNMSVPITFTIINKTLEYSVVIKQEELYIREGSFKFPDTLDGFKSVLSSIIEKAFEERLISNEQKSKLEEFLKTL